jgi:hemerythrin
MKWDAALETGVERIDNQHKELCRLVGMILDKETKIEDTLKFLEAYVVQHFSDEESLQVASKYPELPAHKELHTNFIKVFLELHSQISRARDAEEKEIAIMSLNGSVVDWLSSHIMIHDRHFAEWYKAHM